jgi:hypothetical protein
MSTNQKYILARLLLVIAGAAVAVLLIRLGWNF